MFFLGLVKVANCAGSLKDLQLTKQSRKYNVPKRKVHEHRQRIS